MVKTDTGFDAFTKALASDDEGLVRRAIIAGLAETIGGDSPLFFDLIASTQNWRAFDSVTGGVCPSVPAFSGRGALARWLRVNDDVLVVRDQRGPVDDFAQDERAALQSLKASACVPLVSNGYLVAFVMFCDDSRDWKLSRRHGADPMVRARYAAGAWQAVRQRTTRRQQATASYRAQQLSTAGQLAASVAHEVRNPLAIIRTLVQFVRDVHPSQAEQDNLLTDVMAEVDRIDRTADGFLQISRPHESASVTVDVSALVQEATQFVAVYARRLNVGLLIESAEMTWRVQIDPKELRQVLINLLLNACQACSAGGRVTTAIQRSPISEGVDIVVTDSGCGMTAADLEQAFTPFFTTKPNGTGLGLSMCREVVRRHGGEIALQSTVGVGTAVTISLPLR